MRGLCRVPSVSSAVAMYSGLTFRHNIGGVICCSSYVPMQDTVQDHLGGRRASSVPPIFYGHGKQDMLIPFHYAERHVLRQPMPVSVTVPVPVMVGACARQPT